MANTKNTPHNTSTQQRGQETTFKNTTTRAHADQQAGDDIAPDRSRTGGPEAPHDAVESDVNVPRDERDHTEGNTGQNPTSSRANESLGDEEEADLRDDDRDGAVDAEDGSDVHLDNDGDTYDGAPTSTKD